MRERREGALCMALWLFGFRALALELEAILRRRRRARAHNLSLFILTSNCEVIGNFNGLFLLKCKDWPLAFSTAAATTL